MNDSSAKARLVFLIGFSKWYFLKYLQVRTRWVFAQTVTYIAAIVKVCSEDSVQCTLGNGRRCTSSSVIEINLTNVGLDLGNNQGDDDHRS